MRICIIGKFPPIQGGVSARTYWAAHDLARRGHEVHVVTNAKEAHPPFRMHMRQQDWQLCEAIYGPGSVTVHWTDPVDRSQSYIPMASPFVSKLASVAAGVHSGLPFDVIYSHYLEPYGIAGHLAAEITHVPHVVRMAGSDAGRLWHHPQFETLYDHVLRSATVVIAGAVADRAIKHGIQPERIVAPEGFGVPENCFCPDGPALELPALRNEVEADPHVRDLLWGRFMGELPFFGIYGKLGETKGSFALLAAMQRLKQAGLEVGLLAMAHGWPATESRFRSLAEELDVADRILQIPFLPHWRVPEFLRSCLAVCCLEQNFPIVFHVPVIAHEVLMCGACLVGSTEVLRKLPDYQRLAHGYGCVAIEDVQDVQMLSAKLAAMVRDPAPIASVAARGRTFACMMQTDSCDLDWLEHLLESAVHGRLPAGDPTRNAEDPRFPITQLAASALGQRQGIGEATRSSPGGPVDLSRARKVLTAAEKCLAGGETAFRPALSAIKLEIAIAEAEDDMNSLRPTTELDPLFRFRAKRWALSNDDLAGLVPLRDPQIRMITFDASELMDNQTEAGSRAVDVPRLRHVVAFARGSGERREPVFIGHELATILELSDGKRTALEIAEQVGVDNENVTKKVLKQIENMFVAGLLWLHEGVVAPQELG